MAGRNSGTRRIAGWVLLALEWAAAAPAAAAGPEPVDLRSTYRFAILSGAAITSTGGGLVNGDAGASPIAGSAIGLAPIQMNGTIFAVSAGGPAGSVVAPGLLTQAKSDLTTAYNDAAGRTPVPTGAFLNPGFGNIGGMTLGPGLYKFTTQALISGGNVTLSGSTNDVWIFQVGSDLQIASGAQVVLTNGAKARHVVWQVGTSATIGTDAVARGTIMAAQSITLNTGSALDGRALAFTAGITFNGRMISLPEPEAPRFTRIYRSSADSMAVVLETTPHFLITLETCPDLVSSNWTAIATNTPDTNVWDYIDVTATAPVTQRFYKAFITGFDPL